MEDTRDHLVVISEVHSPARDEVAHTHRDRDRPAHLLLHRLLYCYTVPYALAVAYADYISLALIPGAGSLQAVVIASVW